MREKSGIRSVRTVFYQLLLENKYHIFLNVREEIEANQMPMCSAFLHAMIQAPVVAKYTFSDLLLLLLGNQADNKPNILLSNGIILNQTLLLLIKLKARFRVSYVKSTWEHCLVLCNICIKEVVAKILITCRHFILQQVYGEFNIFICFSVKPSVAVTEQSVENKNKRMFVEVLHEMLTRGTGCTAVSYNK